MRDRYFDIVYIAIYRYFFISIYYIEIRKYCTIYRFFKRYDIRYSRFDISKNRQIKGPVSKPRFSDGHHCRSTCLNNMLNSFYIQLLSYPKFQDKIFDIWCYQVCFTLNPSFFTPKLKISVFSCNITYSVVYKINITYYCLF